MSSDASSSFLSDSVRTKMVSDLAGRSTGWIYFVVMVASAYVISQLVGPRSLHIFWSLLIGALAGSQWEEFQKRKLVAQDDQMLQLLHNDFQGKRAVSSLLTGLGVVAIIGFVALGYFTREQEGSRNAQANCKVEQVDVEPFVFVINDQPDAGFVVKSRIQNTGASGSIVVSVRFSTSEGDFERKTTRHFEANSSQVIRIDFPEPSANAANVQALTRCS